MVETVSGALVGRRDAMGVLLAAARDAMSGTSRLVLITGEPGMGKTRLLGELATAVRELGMAVARGSCWDGDGAPAFWPWTQVLRCCAEGRDPAALEWGAAAGLLPELGEQPAPALDSEQARFRLFDALATALVREAARRPLLVAIDDLHWADLGTLRALRFLTGHAAGAPMLVVAAYRDAEIAAEAAELLVAGESLPLRGLDADEVAELMALTTATTPDPAAARTVARRTGGNPLFVREFATLLASGSQPGGVPGGIRAVLTRRLDRLSRPCRDLLAAAAVAGAEFDLGTVAGVRGLDWPDAVRLAEETVHSGLVQSLGTRFGFAHALIRDTVYTAIPLADRAALHLLVAEGLQPDGDVAEIADHLARAVPAAPAALAAEYAERAGRRSMDSLAFEDAAAAFARALDLVGPDAPNRFRLLLAHGDALLSAGGVDRAREAFSSAADVARRQGNPHDLARAALGYAAGLNGFEVRLLDRVQVQLLEEALGALPAADSTIRATLLGRLSVALTYTAPTERRAALAEESVVMARRLNDPQALMQALAARCDAIAGPGDVAERVDASKEIVELAQRTGDTGMELLGRRLRIVALAERGDLHTLDAEVYGYARVAEHLGQPLYSWYVPLWEGARAHREGRMDDALACADRAAAIGARIGSRNAAMLAEVQRLNVLGDAGRTDGLTARYQALVGALPEAAWGDLTSVADVYLARSDPHFTPRSMDGLAHQLDEVPMDSEWLPLLCATADLLHDHPHPAAARYVYDRLLPYAEVCGVEGIVAAWLGSTHRHLGMLAAVLGRRDDAEAHFQRALVGNAGSPLHLAHTHRVRAEALGTDLAPAVEIYSRLGLTEMVARCGGRTTPDDVAVLRRDGDVWAVGVGARRTSVKHVKGLADLARLVAEPGREFPALDLVGGSDLGDRGAVLDDRAREAYRARLTELDERIADGDERARQEREFLVAELTGAYGLGGRARRTGGSAERARTTVTWRIRDAIGRVEKASPELGRHLRAAVRTGNFCAYEPETPRRWEL